MFGCAINECQIICSGGSTGLDGPFWPDQGCRIVTSYISQQGSYINYNGPDATASGNDCCSNAWSLCDYTGDKTSINYAAVLGVTRKACKIPNATTVDAICLQYMNQCGSPPPPA